MYDLSGEYHPRPPFVSCTSLVDGNLPYAARLIGPWHYVTALVLAREDGKGVS
jgi:hypothetical protein